MFIVQKLLFVCDYLIMFAFVPSDNCNQELDYMFTLGAPLEANTMYRQNSKLIMTIHAGVYISYTCSHIGLCVHTYYPHKTYWPTFGEKYTFSNRANSHVITRLFRCTYVNVAFSGGALPAFAVVYRQGGQCKYISSPRRRKDGNNSRPLTRIAVSRDRLTMPDQEAGYWLEVNLGGLKSIPLVVGREYTDILIVVPIGTRTIFCFFQQLRLGSIFNTASTENSGS